MVCLNPTRGEHGIVRDLTLTECDVVVTTAERAHALETDVRLIAVEESEDRADNSAWAFTGLACGPPDVDDLFTLGCSTRLP